MKIFNGESNKVALQSKNISYKYLDVYNISKSLSETLLPKYIYGLAASNDISTGLIYLALLYNKCSFLIFDPSILKNKNTFISSIEIDKILSSTSLIGLDNDKYEIEKVIDRDLNLHLYRKKIENKRIKVKYPSILLNTSGSSGIPKIVRISYENLISNTTGIIQSLNLTAQDQSISTLPLFYTYGLSILNTHMYTGGTFYFTNNSILQKPFEEEISNFKPSIFSGVPSTFQILKKIDYLHLRQPFIKKITQAGGALDKVTQIEILEICSSAKDFYIMYGQTEATARISCFNLRKNPKKIGSVGRPLNNISIKINDMDDDNKIGRICIKGPSITTGYISSCSELINEPKTRILDTGDLGYLDKDGFLFITGRSSRFCKINGKRYNLDVIEQEYNSSNSNKICVVSDDIFLFVFSTESISKKSIKIAGIHPTLINLILIKNIPLKTNGKIDYSFLLELAYKELRKK